MKNLLAPLCVVIPTILLSSCSVTEIYTPGYNAVAYAPAYTPVSYYGSSPYWGGYGYNGFGYDNGWYGTQNYYGAVVFASQW